MNSKYQATLSWGGGGGGGGGGVWPGNEAGSPFSSHMSKKSLRFPGTLGISWEFNSEARLPPIPRPRHPKGSCKGSRNLWDTKVPGTGVPKFPGSCNGSRNIWDILVLQLDCYPSTRSPRCPKGSLVSASSRVFNSYIKLAYCSSVQRLQQLRSESI